MRLETAEQFSDRGSMNVRQARQIRAAFDAGEPCAECGARATQMRAGRYLCDTDAGLEDQRKLRATMGRR